MSWSAVELSGNLLLGSVAGALSVPLLALSAECLAALLPGRAGSSAGDEPRPAVAVLIPAHNEEFSLPETLRAIQPQLTERDRLIVIADNCTDSTAGVARSLGAEVIERQDAHKRGKGFAMDLGVRHLASDPRDVVVFTDADCLLAAGAIDALARQVIATARPAQAVYRMEPPPGAHLRDAVSAFAFLLKNQVRPTGLKRLGLHCPLYGTGMAFPFPLLQRMPLASGNIVEDLQLGLNLVCEGVPPGLCPAARVIGRLPAEGAAAITQRTRWEHGHVRTIFAQAPRMLAVGIRRRSFVAIAAALDLSVPPLSLLTLIVTLGLIVLGTAAKLGAWWVPFIVLAGVATLTMASLIPAYLKFGRSTLPLRALLGVPAYVVWKMPMYCAMLLRPQKQWVQTPRSVAPAVVSTVKPVPAPKVLEPVGASADRTG